MTLALPLNAQVEAAPSFLVNLDAIHRFFRLQDADSAEARLTKLKAELREMVAILSWSPASGRQARFFSGKSAQTRLRANGILRLAEQAKLPHLREYVVGQNIVLYAHSEKRVVLLSLTHQRQLVYSEEV